MGSANIVMDATPPISHVEPATMATSPLAASPSSDDATDAQLIQRAIDGDPLALKVLWQDHRRWVAAVLLAHMPKDVELEDLLQDVGVAVVGKIASVRESAAFRPWLRAVAMSVAKTSARRRRVRKDGWLRVALQAGTQADQQEDVSIARRETLAAGKRLMELATNLPDGYREPLLLKCIQGMSYREIGRVMNLPDTTVETRIARARRMLREHAGGDQRVSAESRTFSGPAAAARPGALAASPSTGGAN